MSLMEMVRTPLPVGISSSIEDQVKLTLQWSPSAIVLDIHPVVLVILISELLPLSPPPEPPLPMPVISKMTRPSAVK